MCAVREGLYGLEQSLDFASVGLMTKDWQAERGFRDEEIARYELEWLAGGVRRSLVITGNDGSLAAITQLHLRAAENMTCGMEGDRYLTVLQRNAIRLELVCTNCVFPKAGLHDRDRFCGCQNRAMSRSRMIRVAMSDDGPIDGATGIDVKVTGCAVKTCVCKL